MMRWGKKAGDWGLGAESERFQKKEESEKEEEKEKEGRKK